MSVFRRAARKAIIGIQKNVSACFPSAFCLVTGAPRSGTSAVASWIGSQLQVKAFQETKILFAAHRLHQALSSWEGFRNEEISRMSRSFVCRYYAQAGVYIGARLLLDKEPLDPLSLPSDQYGSFVSSIEASFPSVRFVVMVRNPESVVSSMISRRWGYSIEGMEAGPRSLDEGIASWIQANEFVGKIADRENVYVCKFEDLVDKPVQESKEIAQFLGLRHWNSFNPRKTSAVQLSPEECQLVWRETKNCRDHLADCGIAYTNENEAHSLRLAENQD